MVTKGQVATQTTRIFFLLCLLLTAWSGSLLADTKVIVPQAPTVSANAYILLDANSGQILVDSDSHTAMPPASLTKIMTHYVVSKELAKGNVNLDDKVRISEKAWRTQGSRMFVEVNTYVTVAELLRGMVIQSGNDASVALAEHVAGSEDAFASLMNHYAKELGLKNSHFMNSTGLPHEEHYASAYDIAMLSRALIQEFPDEYGLHSQKSFTYNDIKQHNRNKLLWRNEHVDGIKTGHTNAAGYCLAASAIKDDMRLITVVMGTESPKERAKESEKLLTYGFRFFDTHKLYAAGETIKTSKVWLGKNDSFNIGVNEDLFVTVPKGSYDQLAAELALTQQEFFKAPIEVGQPYGTIKLQLDDTKIAELPVVSLTSVSQGNFWQRLIDHIVIFFYQLLNLDLH